VKTAISLVVAADPIDEMSDGDDRPIDRNAQNGAEITSSTTNQYTTRIFLRIYLIFFQIQNERKHCHHEKKNDTPSLNRLKVEEGEILNLAFASIIGGLNARESVSVLNRLDILLGHTGWNGDVVREGSVQRIFEQFRVHDLVRASPISGDVREGISDELDEPVLRYYKSESGPKEEDTTKHDDKGSGNPQVSHLNVIVSNHSLDSLNLRKTAQKECWKNKVSNYNLDLVLCVKSQHGLLLLVARRLKDIVSRLAKHQRGNAKVNSFTVRSEENGITIEKYS